MGLLYISEPLFPEMTSLYVYAEFPRKRCALKFGDEASVTLEMLHLSLTNLLVY